MNAVNAQPKQDGVLVRYGRWAAGHGRRVVVGWVVLLLISMGVSHALETNFTDALSLSGTDSQRAAELLHRDFPTQAGDVDEIVLHARDGKLSEQPVRARIDQLLAAVAQLPHVTGVVSPFSAQAAHAISPDERTAFATITFNEQANALPMSAIKRVISVARGAGSEQLQVDLTGQAIEDTQKPTLGAATAIGLLAAIVILLITFGSATAMALPIITTLLGLGTALAWAGIASRLITTPTFATQLAALIGLGVGIDYALFIVTRFRHSYAEGEDVQGAIAAAMDSAGRAVLFAGATVIVAVLGLFALGVTLLDGVAVSAALAVALTMTAALSLLPVLLTRFGEKIGRRGSRRATQADPSRQLWPRWIAFIQRHPRAGASAGLAIMLALALPALALRLDFSDASNDGSSTTTYRAYTLLAGAFGAGVNGPLKVVVHGGQATNPAALSSIANSLRATPDVAAVSPPQISAAHETSVFAVFPRSAPQALATTELVTRLRNQTLPPLARASGAQTLVGGQQASSIDFTGVLSNKLPLFIAIVVVLSALLLLAVFRSIAIPLQAAAMNLLSVGASLGVIVAVFQWGWLGGLLGVKHAPIEPFIPVIAFAIVFGLSLDYEVFLVSRIHEVWTRRRDPEAALYDGFASTGRVITAAATIMLVVFLSFVAGEQRVLKAFGFTLASAVFLDAFVVRSVLLPATLQLLGRRAWSLPSGLERRLPRVAVHGPMPQGQEG